MKKAIVNIVADIPKSDRWHNHGWCKAWARMLNADIIYKNMLFYDYDEIYLCLGASFSRGANIMTGINESIFKTIKTVIMHYQNLKKIYLLDIGKHEHKLKNNFMVRVGKKSTYEYFNNTVACELGEVFDNILYLKMRDLPVDDAIIGDSHSIAFANKKQAIIKIDGQLLYSVLNKGLISWLKNNLNSKTKKATICLGNIDIRFHVFGTKNKLNAKELAIKYLKEVKEASKKLNLQLQICAAVPVEYEKRKLPKIGMYKGLTFVGSRKSRLEYTLEFNKTLKNQSDFKVISPPEDWYKMDGETYAKTIMEAKRSVHIAPKYYNSVSEW